MTIKQRDGNNVNIINSTYAENYAKSIELMLQVDFQYSTEGYSDATNYISKLDYPKTRYETGDLYKNNNYDIYGTTINNVVSYKGGIPKLVMGAGNAKDVKNFALGIETNFGITIDNMYPTDRNNFTLLHYRNVIGMHTKQHWLFHSDLKFVTIMIADLFKYALKNLDKKFGLPIPAVSNGGIQLREIQNIIDGHTPPNITWFSKRIIARQKVDFKTSYFANRNLPDARYFKVSISQYPPHWFKSDKELKQFAPSRDLLHKYKDGDISEEEYTEIYLKQLEEINDEIESTVRDVIKEAGDKVVVFLCYEKRGDFCHRNIFREYLGRYSLHGVEKI